MSRRCTLAFGLALLGVLALGLGTPLRAAEAEANNRLQPITGGQGDQPPAPWQRNGLPAQKMPFTDFSVATLEGQRALRIAAKASYGSLVHPLDQLAEPPQRLSWRWRIDQPNIAADLGSKAGDDNPVKVCLLFDLSLQAVPFMERQLMRIARASTGQELPAATLCYVWDARLPAGTVLDNAYSRRVRMIVLRGPEAPLQRWQAEQRNVAADFKRVFGDEAAQMPPLRAVAIGGDADNTGARSLAYLADLTLN